MAKLQITVCDRCGALDRSTKRYRIVGNERTVTVELCHEHGKPIDDVIALVPKGVGSRKGFEATVTTIEEIEQRKRERAAKSG